VSHYGFHTEVPVSKSRGDIEHLLRRWGCTALQWTDEWAEHRCELRFRWKHGQDEFTARFDIRLPKDEVIARDFKREPTKAQIQRARDQRWRALHRVMYLRILADLNSVEAGLTSAFSVFVAHVQTATGKTVAEVLDGQNLGLLLPGPTA
jgi:hypothetical protein